MGGLVGSIFDLAEGDPTGKEQKQFGALGDYQTGVGEGLTTAGTGFEENILSGDPSKIASSLAPEISGQQGQIQGQELQNANFGTRSGGTAASTEAAQAQGRGNIINLEGGLQSSTAGAAVGQGTSLIGQGSQDIGQEATLANQRRQQQVGDINGIAQSAAAIASGFGGGDPAASGAPVPWAPPNYLQQTGNAFNLAPDDELGADPFGWGIQ